VPRKKFVPPVTDGAEPSNDLTAVTVLDQHDERVPAPKKRPRVSILERRLQNPFGEPSSTIEFKRQGIASRWFNDATRNGQIHRAKELGWVPVTLDMIANVDSLGHHALNPANQITRGERGQELLMWMPLSDREQIQRAKTVENNRRMGSPNQQRNEMLEAYGATNPDGAEDVSRQDVALTANVRTTHERIQRTGELE
jgi:hypothetical protein